MKAVIIAAGKGSRMGEFTSDKPKCMLEIGGKTILENTISLLKSSGISEIALITGYMADKIDRQDVHYYRNNDYKNNNILHSLMTAKDFFDDDLLITYSDIWLEKEPVENIVKYDSDLVLSIDTDWEQYYEGRTDHPVTQAENALYDTEGLVYEVGKHIDPANKEEHLKCGEFIGLLKVSRSFCPTFVSIFEELDSSLKPEDSYRNASDWRNAYLTDYLNELISRGITISGSFHQKKWVEIDTIQDYMNFISDEGQ
jgi:L-glutamine-phosphate cytidylyltransferase